MLVMPNPNVPNAVWEVAETEEMKEVIGLYGKTYYFWQVDRGDTLPLGKPELMMSFTKDEQVCLICLGRISLTAGLGLLLTKSFRCHGKRSRTEMRGMALRLAGRRKLGRA